MRIIALLNQKGGVGKTTTAVNVGAGLSRLGRRVLLCDLDPQGHMSQWLAGEQGQEGRATLHQVMRGSRGVGEAMIQRGDFWVIPSCLELSAADSEFASTPGKERLLARAMAEVSGMDVLVLDCPPNLGLLTVNALALATDLLIPVQAEYLALAVLGRLMDTVEAAKAFNPGLKVLGMVLTRYNHRKRLCREVAGAVRAHFPQALFETRIRESVALAESPGFGQSIFEYGPASQAALDYAGLCREIAARGGM